MHIGIVFVIVWFYLGSFLDVGSVNQFVKAQLGIVPGSNRDHCGIKLGSNRSKIVEIYTNYKGRYRVIEIV